MPDLAPLRLLLLTFAGWVDRRQAHATDYLVEENRVLMEQLRSRRLRLTDGQRRRLAAKGKVLGRKMLKWSSVREMVRRIAARAGCQAGVPQSRTPAARTST